MSRMIVCDRLLVDWSRELGSSAAVHFRKRSDVKALSAMSDHGVIEGILAGQHDLVDVLVRRYSDQLFRIIRNMVTSRETADDVLQDTWLRVIRKLHKFDRSRELLPWLIQVAINCCRDYLRKEHLRRFWRGANPLEGSELKNQYISDYNHQDVDNQVEIARALMVLSRKLREVVVLKFYSGLTHEEIAQALQVPSGTVKSRLHKAMGKMKMHLKGEEVSG